MVETDIKQRKSITHRFLMYLIVIIVISNLLVFCANYYVTQKSMTRQSKDMSQNLMESDLNMIEHYFGDIDHLAASLIYNSEIIRFMKNSQDKAADLEFLHGVESLYYNSRPDLQLTFYKSNDCDNMYSITQENRAIPIRDYRYSDWYQKIVWTDAHKVIIGNNVDEEHPNFVHSVVYKIEDIYDNGIVGYLKIDMDLETLKERFLHGYTRIAGSTITDAEGDVLFYDKQVFKVPEEVYEAGDAGTYENDDYIMTYGISESTGWRICMAMSKEELFKDQKVTIFTLAAILAAIIGFTVLISNKCFTVITVNFKRLVKGMERVKEGNLTTQVEVDTPDEISFLIIEFNEMMKKTDMLVKQVESKQILLKEAEIKALQQQINPHFMHNIMETIMGLASEGMDDEVITVSKCMSAMLRYNTRLENITVLKEEIAQVQNYVQVLKIRFEDRFEAYYDIDEKCLECRVVKFMLQPLVENAISHGLSETYEGGMLRIRIKVEGASISIMIFDNGTGIREEKLKELKARLEATSERPLEYIERYKSLGLLNVHLRLKLFYGKEYSIEIFSKERKGTCISIKIPFIREEQIPASGRQNGGGYV